VIMPDFLRVLIADDHEGYRYELAETLESEPDIQVVAAEPNGLEAVRRVRALRPGGVDLVLMDVDMPVMNGIDATHEITGLDPELPVIILTVSTRDADLFSGMDSGAVGYLNKNLTSTSLIRALRDFWSNGSLPMSRATAGKAFSHLQHHPSIVEPRRNDLVGQLSWREREILLRIAAGCRDREIAVALFLAESTVKTHVRHILHKLGARNRAEAAVRMRRSAGGL
jgi:DNA-binding NarL/FixJ family response regulator